MSAPGTLQGGCLCGAVRYRLLDAPMFVHCCHCTECQRSSGSAFAVNAPIERGRLHLIQGRPRRWMVPTDTGRTQDMMRCEHCGTALWSHHPQLGGAIALVYTGTLDAPHGLVPQVHLFTRSRQPWVSLPPGTVAVEEHYDLERCWPPASLARLGAALGATAS